MTWERGGRKGGGSFIGGGQREGNRNVEPWTRWLRVLYGSANWLFRPRNDFEGGKCERDASRT
jgi:hypothetical protein